MHVAIPRACWVCCLLAGLTAAGCEVFPRGGSPSAWQAFFDPYEAQRETEERYRERFQADRDPEAMRWLLANAVRQGMTVAEVNRALGEAGQREFNDLKLKTGGGPYRSTDVAYRWGPDRGGRSVYLFFRDGKLTNFDPQEFAD